MGDIFEYLEWRGDIPFSVSPFNEADNLVLAELAYTDLEGIIPEDGGITVEMACHRYFSLHSEEEVLSRRTFYKLAPFLLKNLADSPRFGGMVLSGYINEVDQDTDKQIAAVTYKLPDGTYYLAFRGTDNTIVGWKEDCRLAFMESTAGQVRAAAYLDEMFRAISAAEDAESGELPPSKPVFRVGGHSKGGNLAVYASAFCDGETKDSIKEVWSNDGPGFLRSVTATEEYRSILPRIKSFIPSCSVFGVLLDNPVQHTVIKSDGKLLWQHDALTWQVSRDHFVRSAEQQALSLFVDRTMQDWLLGLDLADREVFIDSIFALLEAGEGDTLEDLADHKLKTLWGVTQVMRDLPEETKKNFAKIAWELLESGSHTGSLLLQESGEEAKDRLIDRGQEARERLWQRVTEAGTKRAEDLKETQARLLEESKSRRRRRGSRKSD